LRRRYEPDDGVDAVDWLGADGVEAVLPPSVLDVLLVAGFRPWNPQALPFGCPRRRRVL
jgi:hypothetical protein